MGQKANDQPCQRSQDGESIAEKATIRLTPEQARFFEATGYLQINELLSAEAVDYFRRIYDDFLSGRIATGAQRSDLSGRGGNQELITQIMRPSKLMSSLENSILHQKAGVIARQLMGEDMVMDFDMLIDKAPHTNAPTPWHQDEAYWIDMPDKRAVSCWVALDRATVANGCMWFVPGSHLQALRSHVQTGQGGALQCGATEREAAAVELHAGSCTFHHGRTAHYSRGNSTNNHRRAFIVNFRPATMVEFERKRGFDHLGKRAVRQ